MNPYLGGDLLQFRPGGLVYFDAFFHLSHLVPTTLLSGQKNLFEARSRPSSFHERDQFIHSIQKFIERLEFFDGDSLEKYSIDAVAAFVPPMFRQPVAGK